MEEDRNIEIKELKNHAVIVGYDEMSKRSAEALEEYYSDIVIVDNSSRNVKELSESKYEYIYGDFRHREIRQSSNISEADFIISFSPQLEVNKKAVEDGRHATVFVKATSKDEAAELYDMGAHYVIMKNVLTGDKVSEYIKDYVNDREAFDRKVKDSLNKIHWSDRDV
jgi:voltage-gated potassium channel Kch